MAKSPSKESSFSTAFHQQRQKVKSSIVAKKAARFRPHRSFRRSYREDYEHPFEAPGLLSHAVLSFKMVFSNWRLFLPLIIIIVLANIAMVGLMSENTFTTFQNAIDESSDGTPFGDLGIVAKSGLLLISTITTGGLSQGMTESQQFSAVFLFIITWLITIFIIRQRLAKNRIKLRDALYNALSPLISTAVVIAVIFVQLIPAMIVIITYSAAVATDFLSTPFYALLYFIFATLLLILSIYYVSGSILALVAVTAPGLYPMVAIHSTSDLISGRRIKFIIRIIYLLFVIAVVWVIVMLPLISLDIWAKSAFEWLAGFPFVSIELLIMTCFTIIYSATYLYLFYRRLLDYDE